VHSGGKNLKILNCFQKRREKQKQNLGKR